MNAAEGVVEMGMDPGASPQILLSPGHFPLSQIPLSLGEWGNTILGILLALLGGGHPIWVKVEGTQAIPSLSPLCGARFQQHLLLSTAKSWEASKRGCVCVWKDKPGHG